MSAVGVIMITMPLFMPIANHLGFNPIWFCVISLIDMQLGLATPPFGMDLFVMKGIVGTDATMMDVIKSTTPFIVLSLLAVALIIVFPQIALWLPNLIRK